MLKRLILLLITVIIGLLPLFGCDSQSPAQNSSTVSGTESENTLSETVSHTVRLPYDTEDTLHPFTVKTVINSSFIPVLYDGLIRLNDAYEPEPVIATSVTGAGTKFIAVLRDNLLFSDGSQLSTKDVVFSYEKAKESARYRAQLENVASVTADGNKVVFELKTPDPLFANLLDFAIIKKGTEKEEVPIGSGRYVAKIDGKANKLVYNTRHYRKDAPSQAEIPLVSMPDQEAMLSGIKTDSLSAIFSDLSKGESSTAGASSTTVDLSNLVYLGFHTEHEFTKESTIRQAITLAIDRSNIFYKGFGGRGTQATLPIHPDIEARQKLDQEILLQYDLKKANQLLDDAGYNQKSLNGFRLKDKKQVTVNILVNADNQFKKLSGSLVKEMLAKIGIHATVVEKDFNQYQAAVKSGNYDLYIGEMKLLNNMSLSPLLDNSGILAGKRSDTLKNAYTSYLDGSSSYSDFIAVFNQELPFIPLLFRSGILIYNRNIKTDISVSVTDVYYNLEEWK